MGDSRIHTVIVGDDLGVRHPILGSGIHGPVLQPSCDLDPLALDEMLLAVLAVLARTLTEKKSVSGFSVEPFFGRRLTATRKITTFLSLTVASARSLAMRPLIPTFA